MEKSWMRIYFYLLEIQKRGRKIEEQKIPFITKEDDSSLLTKKHCFGFIVDNCKY